MSARHAKDDTKEPRKKRRTRRREAQHAEFLERQSNSKLPPGGAWPHVHANHTWHTHLHRPWPKIGLNLFILVVAFVIVVIPAAFNWYEPRGTVTGIVVSSLLVVALIAAYFCNLKKGQTALVQWIGLIPIAYMMYMMLWFVFNYANVH